MERGGAFASLSSADSSHETRRETRTPAIGAGGEQRHDESGDGRRLAPDPSAPAQWRLKVAATCRSGWAGSDDRGRHRGGFGGFVADMIIRSRLAIGWRTA